MATPTTTDTGVVAAYYAAWRDGLGTFDEARLRTLIAADVLFEGPIAGRRVGLESFIHGLHEFAKSLKALRMIQLTESNNQAAAVYDCDLGASGGTLRLAEFLQLENNRIQSVRLIFDPNAFKTLTSAP